MRCWPCVACVCVSHTDPKVWSLRLPSLFLQLHFSMSEQGQRIWKLFGQGGRLVQVMFQALISSLGGGLRGVEGADTGSTC